MITNRMDVNDLLVQMRDMKSQASGQTDLQPRSDIEAAMASNKAEGVATTQPADFAGMFSNAIDSVNETQKASGALATAYQQGDPGVSLSQVMVAAQKSSVSFQALTQVRNKLVEAYQDVMKMPI